MICPVLRTDYCCRGNNVAACSESESEIFELRVCLQVIVRQHTVLTPGLLQHVVRQWF
jgi:hypothetical protein